MRRAWYAAAAYAVIAVAATWPVARAMGRTVAWGLGDPLRSMWAMAWDDERMLALLSGHGAAAAGYFDANLFHPAPLALAYGEHLTAQALQALPVYAVSHDPLLCYNLLFLSTFVLCGLGVYLWVRELTGSHAAAFVGGLLFSLAPYRIAQSAHLSVLSAEWMPLALYGLHRYFDSVTTRSVDRLVGGRVRPLAGAAAAVVLQALSSRDFLFYFTPFAALYAFWEIGRRRQWANLRMWAQLAVAAAAATVVIVPFVLPYVVLHDVFHLIRSPGDVQRGAADVYSYATAMAAQPLWGHLASAWPNAGVELFPGVVPLLLAVAGVLAWRDLPVESHASPVPETHRRIRRSAAVLLAAAAVVHAVAFAAVLLGRHLAIDAGLFVIHLSDANQMLLRCIIALVLLCVVSAGARRRVARFVHAQGFLVLALAAALWLSLGVAPQSLGRPLELFAPYGVLYQHVGGVDALAAPARYGILVALMLAVLGGCGAAVLARRRATRVLLAALAVLFVAEGTVLPFPVNRTDVPHDLAMPHARVYRPARAPAIYAQVAQLPQGSVLAELPLGDPVYDQRAVFYSIVHWRPILNGTGDILPPHYADLTLALSDVPRHPAIALDALRRLGATHVLVHEAAFLDDEGPRTSAALRDTGARELFRDGRDALFVLPR